MATEGLGGADVTSAGVATEEWPSVLYCRAERRDSPSVREPPSFFRELHLDQIVESATAQWKEYDLAPFFFEGPLDLETVAFRHELMHDLEREDVMRSIEAFSQHMRRMRRCMASAAQGNGRYEQERWQLGAVLSYCEGVSGLATDLPGLALHSRGLAAIRDRLALHVRTASFQTLSSEATARLADLASVRYGLLIRGGTVTVLEHADDADLGAVIEQTFQRFRRDGGREVHPPPADTGRLSHVEAQILDRVARLNPNVFAALDRFCAEHREFVDHGVARLERELHFYVAWRSVMDHLRLAGLSFCYPEVSNTSKEVAAEDAFDLALALKLERERGAVVTNDFSLHSRERVIVVSGPNQGGKTTFARMFGQLHYLGALGCPVPGSSARLFLFDHLLVHFARTEEAGDLRGRLHDDLLRMHDILAQATSNSIIIMNELFASTTFRDALLLSRRILTAISRLDLLAVCVTFLDELASFDEKTVSIVSSVDPSDPAVRTFRFARRPADGVAHALALAEKHRVTHDWLIRRIGG